MSREYFKIFKSFFLIFFHEIKDATLFIENPLEFYEASNKFLNN